MNIFSSHAVYSTQRTKEGLIFDENKFDVQVGLTGKLGLSTDIDVINCRKTYQRRNMSPYSSISKS